MPDQISIIGIIASVCTGASLLPQLVKIIKDKKCTISLVMLAVLFLGNSFWVWYGILKNDPIIIVSNSFSILVNLCVIILWLYFRSPSKHHN